jgi:hypothetical protein
VTGADRTEINADGSVASTFRAGQAPLGIAFDGTHMWVTNSGWNALIDAATGEVLDGHKPHRRWPGQRGGN